MAVQFSPTQRAVAIGVASAALLIGAFTLGAGQGSAAPATAGGATGNAAPAATVAAPGGTRITVTGTGKVSGAPNQLALSMGVQTNGTSVAAALHQANSAVRSITAVLRRSGVAASEIQTSVTPCLPQVPIARYPRAVSWAWSSPAFIVITLLESSDHVTTHLPSNPP